jgi:hypothetical protein
MLGSSIWSGEHSGTIGAVGRTDVAPDRRPFAQTISPQ